jgi:hypothetical protein
MSSNIFSGSRADTLNPNPIFEMASKHRSMVWGWAANGHTVEDNFAFLDFKFF